MSDNVDLLPQIPHEGEEHTLKDREYDLLLKLVLGIATTKKVTEAFDFVMETICGHSEWTCAEAWVCNVFTLEMTRVSVYIANTGNAIDDFVVAFANKKIKRGEGILGYVWQIKNTLWCQDLQLDERFLRKAEAEKAGLKAALTVPVPINDEVIAVLAFYLPKVREVDTQFIKLASAACGQIGMLVKQKETENDLRLSERRFRTLIESSHEGIIIIREDLIIVSANKAASDILGYEKDELTEKNLMSLLPGEQQNRLRNALEMLGSYDPTCKDPGGFLFELPAFKKDGKDLTMEISMACWQNEGGVNISLFIRDVTERNAQSIKLAEQAKRLAEEVAERKKVEEELVAKNRELEQFAYVASHDLQEPLRMVASYTQLLARRYKNHLDADAEEFIGFVMEGATRMQALISGLLTYSRIGSRGVPLQEVDMNNVMGIVRSNLSLLIDETESVIQYPALPAIQADPNQMVQLMQNLIVNAIKFRKQTEVPRVHISYRDHDDFWQFEVADNGIGIEEQHRERIFQIFQRLHNREEYAGTGIGLALCKKIVERHGGSIWEEPSPLGGACFAFTIKK
jgi:PAS domain S-box-containing protein